MKKAFLKLAFVGFFSVSSAFAASTVDEPSFTGLNATERAALFGEGSTAQVVALDGAEMKATEGEFFWFAPAVPYLYSAAFIGGNYLINNASRLPATYYSIRNSYRSYRR